MQNSAKSVKSKGLLAFAVNTDTTDYVSIAEQTLKLASQTLGIPYTIVTDCTTLDNSRYDTDINQFVQWNNTGRYQAYELSPYDETIVIDADYLVLEPGLLKIFKANWDYLLMRQACGLTESFPTLMGSTSLPYVWATVFAFKKTPRAKMFFDLVRRVQDNYGYYRELFNIEQRNFRNDYAFAIADIVLNGYTIGTAGLPGTLLNVSHQITAISRHNNSIVIRDSNRAYVLPEMNIHVMSKAYLQSPQFKEFVNEYLA